MLMAYDDHGFTIKDFPGDETRVDLYPIESLSKAKKILAWAKKEGPDVHWIIEGKDGKGPFRVRESM
jgi:hypothetical protein